MSTDGAGTTDARRRLAGRIRAVAAQAGAVALDGARRSLAAAQNRLAVPAGPPAVATAGTADVALPEGVLPDALRPHAGLPDPAAIPPAPAGGAGRSIAAATLVAPEVGAHSAVSGAQSADSDQRPDQPDQDPVERRLGPAILRAADANVPAPLRVAAAWAWRLLLIAAIVYLAFKVTVALRLLVLPFIAAILLCALLQPLAAWLHNRLGLPRLAATWVTLLAAIGVLVGIGILITSQVQAGYPKLSTEVVHTVSRLLHELSGPPFRLNGAKLSQLSSKLVKYIEQHKTVVAGTVLTGGKYFLEVLAGFILTIFITFFLLKDGAQLWAKLMAGFENFRFGRGDSTGKKQALERSDKAGGAAWQALVKYIHGTTIIAVIHAVIIGIALWLLGVPLIMPLAILVFIAAYVPLVGILVVGALAILVTLATQGWVAAVILLAVFLAENQLESHLLQPLVIGRAVRLHPLEIIVVLAIGGIVAGIPGAIVAVPTAAVVSAAWRSNNEARRRDGPVSPPGRKPRRRTGATAAERLTRGDEAADRIQAKADQAAQSEGQA
jgi:predicted PurR-regulated permease PerM